MNARSDVRPDSRVEVPIAVRFHRISRRLRSKLLPRVAPAISTTFGVVSFLTCGGAVVAMATIVALQVH